jgi:hypothetical protein
MPSDCASTNDSQMTVAASKWSIALTFRTLAPYDTSMLQGAPLLSFLHPKRTLSKTLSVTSFLHPEYTLSETLSNDQLSAPGIHVIEIPVQ